MKDKFKIIELVLIIIGAFGIYGIFVNNFDYMFIGFIAIVVNMIIKIIRKEYKDFILPISAVIIGWILTKDVVYGLMDGICFAEVFKYIIYTIIPIVRKKLGK